MTPANTLWGKAFSKTRDDVVNYCAGFDTKEFPPLDSFLLPFEIAVNKAHAEMLFKKGLLTEKEYAELSEALADAQAKCNDGKLTLNGFEDSHSALESFLASHTKAALKIHAGRSRNDLVATTTRLFLKEQAANFKKKANELADCLQKLAEGQETTQMPGYSHHRLAMPFTYSKWLEAYAVAFKRDAAAFQNFLNAYDVSPLGACAGFGTLVSVDPSFCAQKLGFAKHFENPLDAVQQRWEAEASFMFCLCKLMTHLSQVSETLTVLSMEGLELFKLPEEFCTGSSVMPHKKNPDFLEATKAKASVAKNALNALLDAGSNSFTGYNRDSQWTKKHLIHAIVECEKAPALMAEFMSKITPDKERMAGLCAKAQDTLAMERLITEKGMPMRTAKEIVETKIRKAAYVKPRK